MINQIDWLRPWFRAVHAASEKVADESNWKALLNQQSVLHQIQNKRGLPVCFVEQDVLPTATSYEAFIYATGQVPTRDNLHDFFNALVWLSFPEIKRQLNALQAAQIDKTGIGGSRGATRDMTTLFDENAALIVMRSGSVGNELLDGLREHLWSKVFIDLRTGFIDHCDPWLFGHALLEKLVNPYKSIAAHAWVVFAEDDYFAKTDAQRREWLDARVAQELEQHAEEGLHPARFTALPVLGVPGWWPGQDQAFYADQKVFRPKRDA